MPDSVIYLELPEYKLILRKGYSDDERRFSEELLQDNAHLIYKYAGDGRQN